MKNEDFTMKAFWWGFVIGVLFACIVFGVVCGLVCLHNKEREIANYVREYAEKQIEIEEMQEDYGNRDPVEYLNDIPGVRGAADGAAAEFDRKRDEILYRFRNRNSD